MRRLPPRLAFLVSLFLASVPALASAGAAGGSAISPPARGSVEKATEGRVTAYAAGSHVTLRTDDGQTVTFRLDEPGVDAKVGSEVGVGVRARVVEKRLPDGERSVSVKVLAARAA